MARSKPRVILSRKVANPLRDQLRAAKRRKAREAKVAKLKKPVAPLLHCLPTAPATSTGLRDFLQTRKENRLSVTNQTQAQTAELTKPDDRSASQAVAETHGRPTSDQRGFPRRGTYSHRLLEPRPPVER
jgi:hypothetical protein